MCNSKESRNWLMIGKSPKWHTCEACRGSWRVTIAGALQDKTSSLARQLARDSNSQLVQVVSLSRQNALFGWNWLFAFLIHTTINTLIPTKCWELPKRIWREKSLRKTRLTYPQSSSLDSPNSSTLTFSIDISLRSTFCKILISSYPYQWRGVLVLAK